MPAWSREPVGLDALPNLAEAERQYGDKLTVVASKAIRFNLLGISLVRVRSQLLFLCFSA